MMRLVVLTSILMYVPVHCFLASKTQEISSIRGAAHANICRKHLAATAGGGDDKRYRLRRIDRRHVFEISLAALAACLSPLRVIADESQMEGGAQSSITTPVVTDENGPTPSNKPVNSLNPFSVPFKGKDLPLSKLKGKAVLVVNVKNDDPEALKQFPSLTYLSEKYAKDGLRILAFPTDQGWYEPDVSEMVRLRALQNYGFGQFPFSIVMDKVDIVGPTAHPLFQYLITSLPNPNGQASISLNFEKFLLDENGVPLRRYPRKFSGYSMEKDIVALLNDRPLPPSSPKLDEAWVDAVKEAKKSEYAFRYKYNIYKQETASTDWKGIAEEGFR